VRKRILELKSYIPGKSIEEVKKELGLKEIIKFASNETSVSPSSLAVAEL
jgi:histidinol-phosphate aminotransferase